jgi:hypothetical protein
MTTYKDGQVLPKAIVSKRFCYEDNEIFKVELVEKPSNQYSSEPDKKIITLYLGDETYKDSGVTIYLKSPDIITNLIKALKEVEKEYKKIFLLNEL